MKKFRVRKNSFLLKNIFSLNKEQNAQSGAVFRLMVDAVIGLAIIAMILSTLSYFNYLKINASIGEVNNKILAAVSSPNGEVIASTSKLFFLKGMTLTTGQMQSLTGYPEDCFRFKSNLGLIDITAEGKMVEFTESVETFFYARCTSENEFQIDPDESICEVECVFSFGEKLDSLN
jgi:hypothetical protein